MGWLHQKMVLCLTSPIVSELEEKVSKLESELKQCKEDRRKLRIQVTALKKVKSDTPDLSNVKKTRKYQMFSGEDPFMDREHPDGIIMAALGFWEATVGISGEGGEKTKVCGRRTRQQLLTNMFKLAWDGKLYKCLYKNIYDKIKFPVLKIANSMDENVNINYTIIDLFRKMEANIKPYQKGILPGKSKLRPST